MQSFRIICHYCGNDCHCPVPISLKDKTFPYQCANCNCPLAYDVMFDYNNRIGFKDKENITFLRDQTNYTAQRDGEIIIGTHLDDIISAGNKKDVMIFGNAGHDKLNCGDSDTNMCFGGYGEDEISGSGTKILGSQLGN